MAKTAEFAGSSETTEVGRVGKTPDQLNAIAGVDQSKEVYSELSASADETQKMIQSTFETARNVTSELALKVIAVLRNNAEAGLSHLKDLARAQSLSEVIELQTSFLRKRADVGAEQVKDFRAVASKAAEEVSKPIQTAVEKAMNNLKAA
ncbi:phasin [Aminobacter aminovorans]|uniref:Phasin n=1 Tax=Aminobacter aminovorans TaxID=83263 RepID=A0AAC8YQQ3_AMIAI|nr:phasin [Aminobacter aminovorans]AMS42476.1 phasin [Aminobacter aminovorans]MBB3707801.1 phasin [Aminobacter aminovorans]